MSASTPERWRQVRGLFDELVDLELSLRTDRLSEIGRTDPELRDAIAALLATDESAEEKLAGFAFADHITRASDPLNIGGQTISHFEVKEYIAAGGMGVVYRAVDTRLGRTVALKFPLPYRLEVSAKQRFIKEARTAGALDHPNLCPVYEIGESDRGLFLAMPLYQGETLKERLKRASLTQAEALAIARQIAEGLAAAHAASVVHRDLKPGNVMLLHDGTVKILDFGLAKVPDLSETKSGNTIGTLSYMAPEQIHGAAVDHRADLWSLGVVLYEMLSARQPFTRENDAATIHAILNDEPRDVGSATPVSRELARVVHALLQKRPDGRYQDARSLAADLAALEAGTTPYFAPRLPPRAWRWARKHSRAVAASSVTAFAALAIAGAPKLRAALDKPTDNAQAYQLYTRGREYESRGPMAAAESLYQRALALDNGFALARARLAIVYAACRSRGSRDCYRRSLEDQPVFQPERIRKEAEAALRQEPQLADAHFALGLYWEQRDDPVRALREYELARNGLRKDGQLHAAIGRAYRAQGRWNDALRELEHAIELDPKDATAVADLATTYSRLRRYDKSIENWDRYLTLVPDAYQGMLIRGNVYLRWLGTIDSLHATMQRLPADWQKKAIDQRVYIARIRQRPAEALAILDEETPIPSLVPNRMLLRADVYADMGDHVHATAYYDSARKMLEKRAALEPNDYRPQVSLGRAYAGLLRADEARRAAEKAMANMPASRNVLAGAVAMRGAAEIFAHIPQFHSNAIQLLDSLLRMPAGREASVPLLRIEPEWNQLRADPAFEQLLIRHAPR